MKNKTVPKSMCRKCIYHTHMNGYGICCQYLLTRPKNAEATTRTVNPDGSRQNKPGECDKFTEGKPVKDAWTDSMYGNTASKNICQKIYGEV